VDYELASRLNLGLLPFDILPEKCTCCHQKNYPNNPSFLSSDPWHYLSCPARKNNEGAIRHNTINKSISKLISMVGGISVIEPTNLHPDNNLRPDQRIILNDKEYILDVSIIHPTCKTYLQYDYSKRPLGSAENRAMEKSLKYHELMSARNLHEKKSEFIPFIMETYGGISKLGQQFMKDIYLFSQNNQSIWTSDEIKFILRFNLSISLQRGNADLMRMGHSSDSYLFHSRRHSFV